jgi:hypothetical protein
VIPVDEEQLAPDILGRGHGQRLLRICCRLAHQVDQPSGQIMMTPLVSDGIRGTVHLEQHLRCARASIEEVRTVQLRQQHGQCLSQAAVVRCQAHPHDIRCCDLQLARITDGPIVRVVAKIETAPQIGEDAGVFGATRLKAGILPIGIRKQPAQGAFCLKLSV